MNNKSVLFVVDMNNGFCKKGALASERVESIIEDIVEVIEKFKEKNMPIIAFTDCHNDDAVEFKSFPPHCIEGTAEVDIVSEIKAFEKNYTLIKKNSTNAFHEEETQKIINELIKNGYENWYITGCVTDICVKQFALTLKTYFNTKNIDMNVIIPKNCVETFDGPGHDADEMNKYSFMEMSQAGIVIIDRL